MDKLKLALKNIKAVSEEDFQACWNTLKEEYLDDEAVEQYSIDELVSALNKLHSAIEIKEVRGISVWYQSREHKLFPLAEYGWDGGSPIMTVTFNLKTLETNDFGGGPTASIVQKENSLYPGLACHYSPENYLIEIQIFS